MKEGHFVLLGIEGSTSRLDYGLLDTEESALHGLFDNEQSYVITGHLRFIFRGNSIDDTIDDDSEDTVATMRVTFFDEMRIINNYRCPSNREMGREMVYIADGISSDLCAAAEALAYSTALDDKHIGEDKQVLPIFTCYLDRFYVYPKYRNMGVGSYVHRNIQAILEYAFNLNLRCIITYPCPQEPGGSIEHKGFESVSDEEKKNTMLAKMISNLKKGGFKQLRKYPKYYVKYCPDLY